MITPQWLYVLAAATPDRYGDPVIVDETLEPEHIQPGDVVGIGIHTANALRGFEVGRLARRRGAYVVFGGIHVSLYPPGGIRTRRRTQRREERRRHCLGNGAGRLRHRNTAPCALNASNSWKGSRNCRPTQFSLHKSQWKQPKIQLSWNAMRKGANQGSAGWRRGRDY